MCDEQPEQTRLREELAVTRQRLAELEAAAGRAEGPDRSAGDAALLETERHMQILLDATPDVALLIETSGEIRFANQSMAQRFGFSPEELRGRDIYSCLEGEIARSRLNRAQEVIRSGETIHFQDERAGRHFYNTMCPVLGDDGEVSLIAIFARDVTELRRAETALRRTEEKFRRLVETTTDWVRSIDKEGRHTDSNHAVVELLGYRIEEIVGTPSCSLMHPEDAPRARELLQEAVAGRRGWRGVCVRWIHKDGSVRHFEGSAVPLFDDEGELHGFSGIDRDITERIELQEQLLHTQKLESLGILAGGIAHDFNNILTGLLGSAELALLDVPDHSPARPLLRNIQRAGQRAADLTDQMLAYAGKGEFHEEVLSLNALVEDMTSLLASAAPKNVTLIQDLEDGLPPVRGDATQLRQIVLNLVTNAAEAVGDRCDTVRIRTFATEGGSGGGAGTGREPRLAEGRHVVLEVSDAGCGMDEATQERIFDPFFTTKFTGRGLGLAAVQGIVRRHQGSVHVRTAPGRGTTFQVYLPAPEEAREPILAQDVTRPDWRGSGAVLVVEDEDDVRKVTTLMLERLGFSVYSARDGVEGVERFRKHRGEIACVLLDLTMPRMGGVEVVQELRDLEAAVPVILVSGYSEEDSARHLEGGTVAGFLRKPFGIDELAGLLRTVLAAP